MTPNRLFAFAFMVIGTILGIVLVIPHAVQWAVNRFCRRHGHDWLDTREGHVCRRCGWTAR